MAVDRGAGPALVVDGEPPEFVAAGEAAFDYPSIVADFWLVLMSHLAMRVLI
jgi:hypothetical protein